MNKVGDGANGGNSIESHVDMAEILATKADAISLSKAATKVLCA
jgi:hypothetical protein